MGIGTYGTLPTTLDTMRKPALAWTIAASGSSDLLLIDESCSTAPPVIAGVLYRADASPV